MDPSTSALRKYQEVAARFDVVSAQYFAKGAEVSSLKNEMSSLEFFVIETEQDIEALEQVRTDAGSFFCTTVKVGFEEPPEKKAEYEANLKARGFTLYNPVV